MSVFDLGGSLADHFLLMGLFSDSGGGCEIFD